MLRRHWKLIVLLVSAAGSHAQAAECYQTGADVPSDVWSVKGSFVGPFFSIGSTSGVVNFSRYWPTPNKYVQLNPDAVIALNRPPVPDRRLVYMRVEFWADYDNRPTYIFQRTADGVILYKKEYIPKKNQHYGSRMFELVNGLGRNSTVELLSARRIELLRLCWSLRNDDFPKDIPSVQPKVR